MMFQSPQNYNRKSRVTIKNVSGSDSKNVRDFALSDICGSLGSSQTSFYALISFGKCISLTFHLLA